MVAMRDRELFEQKNTALRRDVPASRSMQHSPAHPGLTIKEIPQRFRGSFQRRWR